MTENIRYKIDLTDSPLLSIIDLSNNKKYPINYEEDMFLILDLLNEQDKEIKRLKCINRQLEERLDKSVALDMSKCGDVE